MASGSQRQVNYLGVLRRIFFGFLILFFLITFLIWRIDNPRAERFRMAVIDQVLPRLEWVSIPVTRMADMIKDFQSYDRIFEQNQELRAEVQRMKAWREAAIQLEQENARLLALNSVKLNPQLSFITGQIISDSGSGFQNSAILNVGSKDGAKDGWAAMDGLGLVGRLTGVGDEASRLIFVNDTSSAIPVEIKPSDQTAILQGDGTSTPYLKFVENRNLVQPGDRVVSSGDGGVFPANLLVGQVVQAADGALRVQLAADFRRLRFVRIIRFEPIAPIEDPNQMIGPSPLSQTQSEAADG